MAEDLLALLRAQRVVLAAEQAGDVLAVDPQHVVRRRCPFELVEAEHEVVLGNPGVVRLLQAAADPRDQLAAASLRGGREGRIVVPAQAELQQLRPGRGQRPRDGDGDHAVVEHLEADGAALDRGQAERFAVDGQRRLEVLDVGRRVGAWRQARRHRRSDHGADVTEPCRLGDVVQEERGERTGSDRRHRASIGLPRQLLRSSAASAAGLRSGLAAGLAAGLSSAAARPLRRHRRR